MRILIVTPRQDPATGNWVTAHRLATGLGARGHEVITVETGPETSPDLVRAVADHHFDIALLLHAYRSGAPWERLRTDRKPPYLVLLTGTDINHDLNDPARRPVVVRTLNGAAQVLVQNRLLLTQLDSEAEGLLTKTHLVPPGVSLGNAPFSLRQACHLDHDATLFFCPAGLRPVKGLDTLLEMFHRVVALRDNAFLALAGPILDDTYAQALLKSVVEQPWAAYVGTIPPAAMAAALSDADVVVNNSVSEGLSNVLMEAIALKVRILARDIPGNRELVSSENIGWLFATEDEFIELAVRLIDNPEPRLRSGRPEVPTVDDSPEVLRLEELLEEVVVKGRD